MVSERFSAKDSGINGLVNGRARQTARGALNRRLAREVKENE
jgi:hypothetical protein